MSFRVPNGMSRPTRSGSHVSTSLSLAVDEDGFFGRECPNHDCLAYFKLAVDEYRLARDRRRLTCPVCETTESDEQFFTKDQLERIRAAQIELARGTVNDTLRDLGRRGTSRSGAVSIKWNTPPPYNPKPLPRYVEKQTIRTFTCPSGGHRAVIYDLLAFCPYCGPDETPPRDASTTRWQRWNDCSASSGFSRRRLGPSSTPQAARRCSPNAHSPT